ncbi:MAG: cytochrome b561 domain-containing protein [Cohaesibacter sp.]|nr:cytochrome b561 domain-containing protein [Cohaesibacter sp.]
MLDWLLAPIDPMRAHEVGFALSWHARLMTLAWGVLAPGAVVVARYFKIVPWQDWPRELDNKIWWNCHWMGQLLAYMLSLVGLGLILSADQPDGARDVLHYALGYSVLGLGTFQVLLGFFRGSKGGPTARHENGSLNGDHFNMSPWRLMFEFLHRVFGYLCLLLAVFAIVTGLWSANAPVWMWLVIGGWWLLLILLSVVLQSRGYAIDTYQAIWGPDPSLPGNRIAKAGWGTRRPDDVDDTQCLKGVE